MPKTTVFKKHANFRREIAKFRCEIAKFRISPCFIPGFTVYLIGMTFGKERNGLHGSPYLYIWKTQKQKETSSSSRSIWTAPRCTASRSFQSATAAPWKRRTTQTFWSSRPQDACAILFRRASPSCRLSATPSPQTAAPCGIFWKTKCSAPISFPPRPRSKCRKFLTITSFMWNTTCTGAALQSAATRIKPAPFSAFLKKNITSSQKIIRSRTTSPRI